MENIKYFGHIIDKDVRRPDHERATTIKDLPASKNIFVLQSLLGLSNSSSSSSSCRAGSTDIPDSLSPLLPIVHRPRKVFRTTSRILP